MFEAGQEEKQDSKTKMLIGIFVVVALAALGALYYTINKGSGNAAPEQAAASAAVASATPEKADVVRDLKVQRATMEKDRAGTTAVWSITVQNRSNTYTYTRIQYETTYMGADGKTLLVNKGVLADSIGPGAQATPEIKDAAYPTGTASYKFKITDAKASE